jgi:uroporphyrinogen-III synthase
VVSLGEERGTAADGVSLRARASDTPHEPIQSLAYRVLPHPYFDGTPTVTFTTNQTNKTASSSRQQLLLARRPAARRSPAPAAAASAAGAPTSAAASPDQQQQQQRQATAVVTREAGKNGKLLRALAARGVAALELPLIEHGPGADRALLPSVLSAGGFDWVALTSPEAASVYLEGWKAAGQPEGVRLAVVGKGTGDVVREAGLEPLFTATTATGKVMGAELPRVPGGTNVVLYPASAKAGTDLQNGLTEAGFQVRRLHTYDTRPVSGVAPETLAAALAAADVVTFGSPSAVKAWVGLVGLEAAMKVPAACIGETSARACAAAGLERVHFPEAPGIDGWAEAVVEALAGR